MKKETPRVYNAEGVEVPWVGLRLESHLANTTEQIDGNIEAVLESVYEPFNGLLTTKSGAVAIVGSGPSLKRNWHELKKFDGDIVACNAAIQFLSEKGINPTYGMIFDADILTEAFVQKPNPLVTYLLASRTHPSVFKTLREAGCKIIVWHARGDLNIERLLQKHKKMEPMIGGGSAAVTRAMFVVYPMGYSTIHMYGSDSSYEKGVTDTHIGKSTTEEKYFRVMCGDRLFDTTPWMAQQAEDFKVLVPSLRRMGIRIVVHGDGLIPHIAREMKMDVDGEPFGRQFLRNAKIKAKTLWMNL